mmetsp:Transcript_68090/g.181931  ORF Transcript_68090/g.181931 Transcript_68090/m.181931 type:complete len:104 (-) Transcript_68090:34-345(-)
MARDPTRWLRQLDGILFFNNTTRTVEPHLIHKFDADFYGSTIRLVVVARLRPELSFPSIDDLITAIHEDIRVSSELLDQPGFSEHRLSPSLAAAAAGPPPQGA